MSELFNYGVDTIEKGNQIVWDKKSSHNLVENYLQFTCN